MTRKLLILAACCVFTLSACGGDGDGNASSYPAGAEQQAATLVEQAIKAGNLPGVVVGVWAPGQTPLIIERGVADRGTGRLRAASDPFRIASISKTFTATAILKLVDAGTLSTSDKLATWYPNFPNADRITVGDLLRMRSGIVDAADTAFLEEYYANPLLPLTPDDMIARSAARVAEFVAPNTTTRYNNTNFIILARIVEKASRTDIRSYLAQHVFTPLGLKSTLYASSPDLASPLHGYSFEAASGQLVDRTRINPNPPGGAGAVVSTLEDLHVFVRAICRGDLLKPATQRERLTTDQFADGPALVRYGEGLGKLGRFCGHNGTIFGFSTEMWYLPERDAVIVISVNRLDKDDQSQSTALFLKISKTLFPDLVDW